MPENYYAFGKTVCDIEMANKNKQELNKNQFFAYSEINDSYLDMDDYLSSKLEMIARSFEKFISDTVASSDDKIRSLLSLELTKREKDSLLVIVEKDYISDFFPQGEIADKLSNYWSKTIPEMSKILDENSEARKEHKKKSIGNNLDFFIRKRTQIENESNSRGTKLSS